MTPSTLSGRRLRVSVVAAGLILITGLVGCSASGKSNTGSRAVAPAAPAYNGNAGAGTADKAAPNAAAGGAAPQAAGAGTNGAAALKPEQLPQAGGRSIIYTGTITVRVNDVDDAANQLVALATGAGGFIGGDQRDSNAGRSTATITLRVPADKFTTTLDRIRTIDNGREQSRQVSTQDVTANVVDLDARIQAQQASVDRVRALLAKAQSISEITSVESELSRRESDLESLQAQQRSLADLTALSTITVSLLGPEAAAPAPPKKARGGFLGGLDSGWRAFTGSVRVVLTVLGALLPFLVAIGVPAALGYGWLRRRRRLVPAAPALPAGTVAPKPET
jgi:uncharacterized protein DUF4349